MRQEFQFKLFCIRRGAVLIVFFFVSLHINAQTFVSSNQQWVQSYFQCDITPKTSLGFDAGFRTKNEFTKPAQYIARISYRRKFSPQFSWGGGFAHSGYFDAGAISTVEFRPYQELLFTRNRKKSNTQIRYRSEERFFINDDETGLPAHRFVFRNRLSFSHTFFLLKPFKDKEHSALLFFCGR